MISFRNVCKSFGARRVLDGVSFDVADRQVFFIIGPSGVGKSVLIKNLIGLIRPDSGEILLDGVDVTKLAEPELLAVRRRCAMVFQHSTLFDSMTCAENVALPLRKHRRLRASDALDLALQRLEQVQMREFAGRYPAELGDGMRKRVAIARALTLDPQYVLFDEPTTSLDMVSARRVDALIRSLSESLGVTSIVVSHDLRSIFGIAEQIAMLYQGRIRLLGPPRDFRSSDDPVVRQFVEGRADGPMDT